MRAREWIISVEGKELYWRKNSLGYSSRLLEAGLYTEEEARRKEEISRNPKYRAIHITEFTECIKEDYRFARRKLEALKRSQMRLMK